MSQSSASSVISTLASLYEDIAKHFQFPSNYKLLGKLGEGGFGMVLKCFKVDTRQVVAVKIQEDDVICGNELTVMNSLMKNNLDESNIIRFIEVIPLKDGKWGLVYEMLDVTLQQHLITNNNMAPLDLHNIRSVIQQLATALDALKSHQFIHSDVKLDNIMLVDAGHQPLQVKLIDFGLAFPTSSARQGTNLQALDYMAPEIILGLPFSEAIDMWSLGIVMMVILTGDVLFASADKYGVIRYMVEILGFPPNHLLDAGMYSTLYFNRRKTGQWELKAPEEYWQDVAPPDDIRAFCIRDLDQVELLPLPNLDGVDAEELKECIDLLKAMLKFDASERITPNQVLTHPFIKRGNFQLSSDSQEQEPRTTETARQGTTETSGPSLSPIHPAQTVCCLSQEENVGPSCSHSSECYEPPHLCPQIIQVKPAPPESCLRLEEDTEGDFHQLESRPGLPPYFENSSVLDDTDMDDEQPSKTKKKKKNIFSRFCRWVKRKVFCCTSVVHVQG